MIKNILDEDDSTDDDFSYLHEAFSRNKSASNNDVTRNVSDRRSSERRIRFNEDSAKASLRNIELHPKIIVREVLHQSTKSQRDPKPRYKELKRKISNYEENDAQNIDKDEMNSRSTNDAETSNLLNDIIETNSTEILVESPKESKEIFANNAETKRESTTTNKSYQKLLEGMTFELKHRDNVTKKQNQKVRGSLKNLNLASNSFSTRQANLKRNSPPSSSIEKTFCQNFYDEHKHSSALIIFGIKSLKLEEKHANLEESPKTVCITFMNYESVITDFIFENSNEINFRKIYEVNISTSLVENLANKSVLFELHVFTDEGQKLMATGDLHTKSLLFYPQKKLTTILDLFTIKHTKRAFDSRFGQLIIKMQLVINMTQSKDYEDDIFDSNMNLLDSENADNDDSNEYEEDFIEVPLESSINSRDSLFNIDIHDSSSSEDFCSASKKSSIKVPDWKRSLEEYATLKGYSSTLIKLNKWKEEHLLNIPIRNYELSNSCHKTEVVISIFKLIILKDSFIMSNDNIRCFFLDYNFLTHTGSDMESTLQCKPTITNEIEFNHIKIFTINPSEDFEDCNLLVKAIRHNQSIDIKLICEPIENTLLMQTCYTVGIGAINIFELIQEEENELDLKVPILTENEKIHLGYFTINVCGIQAMREVSLYTIKRCLDKSDVGSRKNFEDVENDENLMDRYEILNRFIKTDGNEYAKFNFG